MIRYKAPYFHLSTSGTSYVMKITERGTLEHVCYGVRIMLTKRIRLFTLRTC